MEQKKHMKNYWVSKITFYFDKSCGEKKIIHI